MNFRPWRFNHSFKRDDSFQTRASQGCAIDFTIVSSPVCSHAWFPSSRSFHFLTLLVLSALLPDMRDVFVEGESFSSLRARIDCPWEAFSLQQYLIYWRRLQTNKKTANEELVK